MRRPYVLLSVATSVDGLIDDTTPERLLLSNEEDLDRVDQVRSEVDAILVGAGTIRADNPRFIVQSDARRAERVARGLPEHPMKVTVSGTGNLDSSLKFWHHGDKKIVYTTDSGFDVLRRQLAGCADIVSLGQTINFGVLLADLRERGVERLMVEGGSSIHAAFLSSGLVDEIHLAIAPIVVGEADAPRFLNPASYPGAPRRRMRLLEARAVGDVVFARYKLT